ncbi:Uncharacterized protein PFLU_5453 [Pseudomonas [fluorescens] SBW25]|uniref:Uncharacterized protein n=1 Tax=Pseudomonas fluorescens (strain SBW25) TaxID=216595 RepID=C3K2Q2_PSEFS|nr:Uncharacterized protein PFLU_5453 [Pseudomonas fluorescens SBW25]
MKAEQAKLSYLGCIHSTARSATIFAISTKCITALCGAASGCPSTCDVATAHCSNSATRTQASSKLSSSLTVNGLVAADDGESEKNLSITKPLAVGDYHRPFATKRAEVAAVRRLVDRPLGTGAPEGALRTATIKCR